jgi:hypothetical protein
VVTTSALAKGFALPESTRWTTIFSTSARARGAGGQPSAVVRGAGTGVLFFRLAGYAISRNHMTTPRISQPAKKAMVAAAQLA